MGVTLEGWSKIKGAAQYAGVSERTFRRWLKQGLRHIRLESGTILVKYTWIDEFLGSMEVSEHEVDQMVAELEKDMLR
jgi:predicted site-specific integrase-resolvase